MYASVLALALGACTGDVPQPGADDGLEIRSMLPLFTVDEPLLEIGEFEGGGDQTLDLVTDVRPLPDGSVAVVDQGAAHVRVYGPGGSLRRTIGRRGDGPGEFRRPGVLLVRDDSLWVTDEYDRSVSRFTMAGDYADEVSGPEFSGDERFPLDALFEGRFWLDGVIAPERRAAAREIASRLDFPLQRPDFRMARATADGRLWVLERVARDGEPSLWMRVGPEAEPEALVELPADFEPLWIDGDEVWGVRSDDFDVHYVRRHALVPSGRMESTPDWVAERSTTEPVAGEARDSAFARITRAMKLVATAQEIHYAEHYTYTFDVAAALDGAGMEIEEGVHVQMLDADGRGQRMILTADGLDAICGLAYGNTGFSGVIAGALICGNRDEPTWWDRGAKSKGDGAETP